MSDEKHAWHMRRALRLAEKGKLNVAPNPMVGAVIVKNGERIGEGFHEAYGFAHAEVNAIESCVESCEGSTLYVTLEPCCHEGKTPPCVNAIVEAGISRVFVAMLDPSDKVSGKGVELLRAAGIEVNIGLLEEDARILNRHFVCFHEKKRPFITLKVAMSLDAKVSEARDVQTQLTSSKAQKHLHILRAEHQAILVGAGTALTDDPHLGVRLIDGSDPLRIVFKSGREMKPDMQIFRDDHHWIYEFDSFEDFFRQCRAREITSILLEGGPRLFKSYIDAGFVDEFKLFYAPKFLGESALPFLESDAALSLDLKSVRQLACDLLVTATPAWDSDPS